MKKQYKEPIVEITYFELDAAIAAEDDLDINALAVSGFENDIPIDGDLMD